MPWRWEQPDYRDDDRQTVGASDGAQSAGRVQLRADPRDSVTGEASGWQLMPRALPPMEETVQRFQRLRRVSGVAADDAFMRGVGDLVIPPRTTATVLVDQGVTTNAYPTLETSGGDGATVTLTYAEALIDSDGKKGHRDSIAGRTMRLERCARHSGGCDVAAGRARGVCVAGAVVGVTRGGAASRKRRRAVAEHGVRVSARAWGDSDWLIHDVWCVASPLRVMYPPLADGYRPARHLPRHE